MKKLRPILFSTPMVQAILEGRKTQTRRVVKARSYITDVADDIPYEMTEDDHQPIKCPYGKVGDVLWVRETFSKIIPLEKSESVFVFKADDDCYKDYVEDWQGWKPSIHMLFEAARIFLAITNIRVERLYDISQQDSINEGIEYLGTGDYGPEWKCYFDPKHDTPPYTSPQNSFMSLWVSINGLDSWDANPWVWVVEFKRITKEEALS